MPIQGQLPTEILPRLKACARALGLMQTWYWRRTAQLTSLEKSLLNQWLQAYWAKYHAFDAELARISPIEGSQCRGSLLEAL